MFPDLRLIQPEPEVEVVLAFIVLPEAPLKVMVLLLSQVHPGGKLFSV